MGLCAMGVRQVREGLLQGRFSCEEYVQAIIERSTRHRDLNGWSAQSEESLLRAARAADVAGRVRDPNLPLAGVPLGIKDNIDVAGLPGTAGTGALQNRWPARNAVLVNELLRAGALIAGKTGMHELAIGITNNNAVTGPVRNPYDPQRSAGGSSGGSACVVAAGMVPAALGTDTGGSVRLPAALCGLAGLRPTLGRYAPEGVLPLCRSRDTVGPITKDLGDAALLDAVLTGDHSLPSPNLTQVRLGLPRNTMAADLDADVARVFEEALDLLSQQGITLIEADVPRQRELNEAVGFPLVMYELERDLPAYLNQEGLALTLRDIHAGIGSRDVANIVAEQLGDTPVTEAEYHQARRRRWELQAIYADYFRRHRLDAMVFPTTVLPAPVLGEDVSVELNGRKVPTFLTYIRNTDPGSVAGLPGITLPIGLARGLPVGLALDGPHGSDRWLLSLGMAIERCLPGVPPPALA